MPFIQQDIEDARAVAKHLQIDFEIVNLVNEYREHVVHYLVEGYKQLRFPKIELHRSALNKPYLFPEDPSIEAIACDEKPSINHPQMLDINNIDGIAEFVYQRFFSN